MLVMQAWLVPQIAAKQSTAQGAHSAWDASEPLTPLFAFCHPVLQISKSAEEQAAWAYAEAKLAHARDCIADLGSKFPPELHFLYPGGCAEAAAGLFVQASGLEGMGAARLATY
jgi:hypothetical protein